MISTNLTQYLLHLVFPVYFEWRTFKPTVVWSKLIMKPLLTNDDGVNHSQLPIL